MPSNIIKLKSDDNKIETKVLELNNANIDQDQQVTFQILGKLDLLFCISHLLDLCVGKGVIIHYSLPAYDTLDKSTALRPLKVCVSLLVRS